MEKKLRIGTRDSQLAVWQAKLVKDLLGKNGISSELVFIKSEGDTDLKTPLYELGVQGIFTKALDIALLNNEIDIAVHSMKDVPTVLAKGIIQAAVLPRASYKDILVPKNGVSFLDNLHSMAIIATSSTRRKAQWVNRYPNHRIENLRGNVNTRLRKVRDEMWDGAIFAAAGLERINLKPANAVELSWMLPAPAQGAIVVVCREQDNYAYETTNQLNDERTELCTKVERDFLRALLGGCTTPISGLAEMRGEEISFKGNILSLDGKKKAEINKTIRPSDVSAAGKTAAVELLKMGGQEILDSIKNGK
jgi:hydroxymethylbilane synthase